MLFRSLSSATAGGEGEVAQEDALVAVSGLVPERQHERRVGRDGPEGDRHVAEVGVVPPVAVLRRHPGVGDRTGALHRRDGGTGPRAADRDLVDPVSLVGVDVGHGELQVRDRAAEADRDVLAVGIAARDRRRVGDVEALTEPQSSDVRLGRQGEVVRVAKHCSGHDAAEGGRQRGPTAPSRSEDGGSAHLRTGAGRVRGSRIGRQGSVAPIERVAHVRGAAGSREGGSGGRHRDDGKTPRSAADDGPSGEAARVLHVQLSHVIPQ